MAFPNVPNVPGVPALPRLPGVVAAAVDFLTSDSLALFAGVAGPVWGLFLNNAPVVTAETVVSFDFKKSSSISSFPVEQGSFESYNKVMRPFDVRLRFATGGTAADRQELLESCQAAVDSLDLMDAVSPEAVYTSINPLYMDYRRTSHQGVTLLQVDVFCEEVRVRSASTFTTASSGNAAAGANAPNAVGNTASANQNVSNRFPTTSTIVSPIPPSASPIANGGTVQAMPATADQFSLSQALP